MNLGNVDYTVPAGHVIEVRMATDDSSDQHMMVAYDTVDQPSRVILPSASGAEFDMELYLHNNPTSPIGDTNIQHPLPTDGNPPTATALYNYDLDRDNFPGRVLQESNDLENETHKFKHQNWHTAALVSDFHIQGNPTMDVWLAMMNYDVTDTGVITVCLRDGTPSGPPGSYSFSTIICNNLTIDPSQWEPDGFAGFVDVEVFSIQSSTTGHTIKSVLSIWGDGTNTLDSWTLN
jgi:hypothetical protein